MRLDGLGHSGEARPPGEAVDSTGQIEPCSAKIAEGYLTSRKRRPTASRRPLDAAKLAIVALCPFAHVWFTVAGRADDLLSPTYERDIKPLFAKRCTVCHRAAKRGDLEISGGLALDSYEGILAGTTREKVVVPGHAGGSALLRRLADTDDERRMPLDDRPLPEPQQAMVRRWIELGAPRGVAAKPVGAAARTAAAILRPRRVRAANSLEVVLPCDAKLPPGTLIAPRGGALAMALRIGPLPAVSALALRGDSRLLAVGTYGQVVLWDLCAGRPAGALFDIPGAVHALAMSRDGRRLAVGAGLPARSGVLRVYSIPDGTLLHDFPGHDDVVYAVVFRPDGAQLASASFDQTVRLWNLGMDRPDGVFGGHSDFVYSVAYTPDGRALLTAAKDRTIKRIDVRTLKEERTYSGHDDDVLALAVHPDGIRFVSAGNEPQIRWWTLSSDKPPVRRGGHSAPVLQLVFSGDGRRLISAGADTAVRLWDGKTGAAIRQLPGAVEWQYAAAISDDGRLAAAGGWDGLVRLWDADSGRLIATFTQPPGPATSASPEPSGPNWLVLSPSGHVAASPELLRMAQWRAGGVALPAEAARAVCDRPDIVARAVRGETVEAVSFPLMKGK
jgi:hypothetical protein